VRDFRADVRRAWPEYFPASRGPDRRSARSVLRPAAEVAEVGAGLAPRGGDRNGAPIITPVLITVLHAEIETFDAVAVADQSVRVTNGRCKITKRCSKRAAPLERTQ